MGVLAEVTMGTVWGCSSGRRAWQKRAMMLEEIAGDLLHTWMDLNDLPALPRTHFGGGGGPIFETPRE